MKDGICMKLEQDLDNEKRSNYQLKKEKNALNMSHFTLTVHLVTTALCYQFYDSNMDIKCINTYFREQNIGHNLPISSVNVHRNAKGQDLSYD